MKRDLIIAHHVDAFNDVDFSAVRPYLTGAQSPEGRPYLPRGVTRSSRWKFGDGHTEHPYGICRTSIIINAPIPYASFDVMRTCKWDDEHGFQSQRHDAY